MGVGLQTRRVAIVGGVRVPFARANGVYAELGNQELLTAALRALVTRFGLEGQSVGEVAAGAVIKHANQWNLARESALGAGLKADTPAVDLQRACATSLEATLTVANKIALGHIDSAIAGGADSISDPPVAYPRSFQRLLLRSYRARGFAARAAPWLALRPRDLKPVLPGSVDARTGLSLGASAESMARAWAISREEQDRFALDSHRKAAAAYAAGFYTDLVQDLRGLSQDESMRADLGLESLALLRPAFAADGAATLTAGNSAPLSDGASALLLASEAWARERGLPVRAFLTFSKCVAVDYVSGRDGLLMGSVYAVPALLKEAGLALPDIDFVELHEAFAGQVLSTLAAWENPAFCRDRLGLPEPLGALDRSRLNVKGGSIALGHPSAATGTRMVATLAKILDESRARRGLVAISTAGGMGLAAILER
jgi:acetyl-CoA C-acetyltransferase